MNQKESQSITDRLKMDHLPATEELRKEAEKAVTEAPKKPVPENDPKFQKEYTFNFDWTDRRGQRWQGKFVNHILTIREREMVGLMRARLNGGLPYEALDPLTQEINLIVSHLAFSLAEERPDWAKDLRDAVDVELLQALYGEVSQHEGTFFGWGKTQAVGTATP